MTISEKLRKLADYIEQHGISEDDLCCADAMPLREPNVQIDPRPFEKLFGTAGEHQGDNGRWYYEAHQDGIRFVTCSTIRLGQLTEEPAHV